MQLGSVRSAFVLFIHNAECTMYNFGCPVELNYKLHCY